MRVTVFLSATLVISACASPIAARVAVTGDDSAVTGGGGSRLPPYLQCVPYARQVSGINIFGDAWTWWTQAEGRYARGAVPRVGAVMALRPHGNSHLGHVAAVSRIIDSRTILIRHANWSPIDGRRGQIEDNVRAVDVSPDNDWSEVRIWYAPIGALGGSHWPVQGFIYPARANRSEAIASPAPARQALAGTNTVPAKTQTAAKPRGKDWVADVIGRRTGW